MSAIAIRRADDINASFDAVRRRSARGKFRSTPRMIAYEVATRIAAAPEGGSLDPRTLKSPKFGADDWCVSIAGHEQQYRGRLPQAEHVLAWLLHGALSALVEDPRSCVGWWQDDDGCIYLDVSLVVHGRDAAIDIGRREDQLAIYCPEEDRTVRLQDERQHPAVDDNRPGILARIADYLTR